MKNDFAENVRAVKAKPFLAAKCDFGNMHTCSHSYKHSCKFVF